MANTVYDHARGRAYNNIQIVSQATIGSGSLASTVVTMSNNDVVVAGTATTGVYTATVDALRWPAPNYFSATLMRSGAAVSMVFSVDSIVGQVITFRCLVGTTATAFTAADVLLINVSCFENTMSP